VCKASTIADDWVNKGFHLHIGEVEICMYPDHLGGIGFKGFFSSTDEDDESNAIRTAVEKCLEDAKVRAAWFKRLDAATAHMLGYRGSLQSLANGRMFEFKRIRIALRRWEVEHGYA
jgi:Arc/MetJ-type ribon-helix-helix transcriptional regulator